MARADLLCAAGALALAAAAPALVEPLSDWQVYNLPWASDLWPFDHPLAAFDASIRRGEARYWYDETTTEAFEGLMGKLPMSGDPAAIWVTTWL